MDVLGITFLAVFLEGTITYIASATGEKDKPRPWVKYVALAAGVGLAIGYKIDLPAQLGLASAVPFLGYIVSGIVIGRGSNYLNDFFTLFKNK